jgi:hypothetical protein
MHISDAPLVAATGAQYGPWSREPGSPQPYPISHRYLMIDYDFQIIKCLWPQINLISGVPGNLKLHIL